MTTNLNAAMSQLPSGWTQPEVFTKDWRFGDQNFIAVGMHSQKDDQGAFGACSLPVAERGLAETIEETQ